MQDLKLSDIQNEIENLKVKLNYWNKLYYEESSPEVSDEVYDAHYKRLVELEINYPSLKTPDSPSQKAGSLELETKSKKYNHSKPMLSLENVFGIEDLKIWLNRSDSLNDEIVAELKIDGLSVSIFYENGKFQKALTRGNGLIGEDISENVKTIKTLPLEIPFEGKLEVRGEIFMTYSSFEKLIGFANPRNAASGSVKLLDSKICAERNLSVFIYELISAERLFFHFDNLQKLIELGFPVNPNYKLLTGINQLQDFCENWDNKRKALDYPTDGIVFKLNSVHKQQELGQTSKYPRWAVAYKFVAERAETQITNILVEVGRTGAVTPVAEVLPVQLAGTTVCRASLHNSDYINNLDIRLSDFVLIHKAGEIIPEIIEVIKEKRKTDNQAFIFPTNCPSCGTELARKENEVAIRCPNTKACPAQIQRKIEYWASKNAMEIKGLGEAIIKQLLEQKLINAIPGLYKLEQKDLLVLEGFKEKSINNLLKAIENSKNTSLDRLINALGIRYIGATSAKLLSQNFDSLTEIANASLDELKNIHGIGEIMACEIYDFFQEAENRQFIKDLEEVGIKATNKKPALNKEDQTLLNKTFVITGAFDKPRAELEEIIISKGGKVLNSISRKTDYLLCGENAGSKLEKAQNLNIKILQLSDFIILTN